MLADQLDEDLAKEFDALDEPSRIAVLAHARWVASAHSYQIPPPLEQDYHVWMMLAGRGAGKTRSAAEALWWWCWITPQSRGLVLAPTSNDLKFTCFEGVSGLLNCIPEQLIADYNKQDHQIKMVNGSIIRGISADSYERLRGPQFHYAWCCAAGTMIEMAGGGQAPIESLSVGDVVMTRHGPRKVLAAGLSGNPNELVTIECGVTRLTVTIDHPILVDGRWIPAGDIREGDRLWVTSTSAIGTRIESSMSSTTAPFRGAGLFTTGTGTRETTRSRIWRRCQEGSISGIMRLAAQAQRTKLGRLLNRSGQGVCRSLRSAFNALWSSSPLSLGSPVGSAPGHAWRSGAATPLCLSPGVALFAGSNTSPRSASSGTAASDATQGLRCGPIALERVAVRRVERLPNAPTYNLTVAGEHEFIANGIVVHNCDELAAFQYLQEAWDMMQFGLRLGKQPRVIVTTTPRPKDLILELVGREGDDVVIDRASTYDNANNLAPTFRKQLEQYKGTKLYEQEVLGSIVDLEDGKVVSRDMFRLFPAKRPFPKFEFIVQSYDCAFSEREHNDPTAMTTWGVFKPLDGPMSVLLIDCWAEHLTFPKLKDKVLDEWRVSYGEGKDAKRPDLILVEEKAAGISLIQELQKAHLPVRGYNPGRADKMQRLQITAAIFAAGRVWLPESDRGNGMVKDWAEGFLSQICSFPDSTHDDYVDSATQAMRLLKDMNFLDIDPEPRYDDDDDYVEVKPQRVNPYAE